MAQIGLQYMVCAPLNEDGKTYGPGRVIAQAISVNISLNFNTADLWGDDRKIDLIREFNEGTITLGGDYISFENRELLLGSEHVKAENGQPERLISRIDDDGQFVGIGFFSTTRANASSKYRAIWLTKTKFSATGETLETKSGGTSFQTPSLEGSILANEDGIWKEEAFLKTPAEAKAWLQKMANIDPVGPVAATLVKKPKEA